jgi:ribosomal protein S6--L-glutamate ligase
MILSFHPCFIGDNNIICAGRPPGSAELRAIKRADAVVLPQGCSRALYEMASDNCSHVFPNYRFRFNYPDKLDQIQLFRKKHFPHPSTHTYLHVNEFSTSPDRKPTTVPFDFPFVFKYSWGGEGDTVFLIRSGQELRNILKRAVLYEQSGHTGFLIQEYIQSDRTLRIVLIGETMLSYWRLQNHEDPLVTSVSKGARIDPDADPELIAIAEKYLQDFCQKTGINLAAFDVIFSADNRKSPYFLEINYFFGRRGIGGSERYYQILITEIKRWIDRLAFC